MGFSIIPQSKVVQPRSIIAMSTTKGVPYLSSLVTKRGGDLMASTSGFSYQAQFGGRQCWGISLNKQMTNIKRSW